MISRINKFFINRPALSFLIFITFIILGYYSYRNLPKRQYPLAYTNKVKITTHMQYALPQEIEQRVTIPFEKVVLKIPGVYNVTSTSKKGISIITLSLEDTFPVDETMALIQGAVTSLDLPDSAEQPVIKRQSMEGPTLKIAVFGSQNNKKLLSAATILKNSIEKISLVHNVEITGLPNERIAIELSPNKLRYYELSIQEIVNAVQANLYQVSCGIINSDNGRIYVHSGKSMETIDEIENILIRTNYHNNSIRLKDLGKIFYEFPEADTFERYNGSPMVRVDITCLPRTDWIKVSNHIRSLLPKVEKECHKEIKLHILSDKTGDIRRRIKLLLINGLYGSLIVFSLIILFMNARSLILIVMGIIFSFCGMLFFMYITSMTINVVSLFGMIMVLGMLVDDSIMVSENINRHLMDEGIDLHSKVLLGVREIAKPVILTVLTTIVAYFPLTQLWGIIGKMLRDIPFVILFALSCSLFESIFIMPSHMIKFLDIRLFSLRNDKNNVASEKKWFEKFRSIYIYLLQKSLPWRYIILCTGILFLFISYYIYERKLEYVPLPQDLVSQFSINVKVKNSKELLPLIEKIEDYFLNEPYKEFNDLYTTVNRKDNYYDIKFLIRNIVMKPKKLSLIESKSKTEIKPILQKYSFTVSREGTSFSENNISIDIKGMNFHVLHTLSSQLQEFLKTMNGITEIEDDSSEKHRGISIKIKELAAHQRGVDYKDIAQSLKYLMGDNEILILPNATQEQSVNIRLKYKDDINYFPKILNQLIKTKNDRLIPLSQLITYSVGSGITRIKHQDGYRTIKIHVAFNEDKITARNIRTQLKKKVNHLMLENPGYIIEYGEEQKDIAKTMSSLHIALIAALIIVFIVLYLVFNSLIQPLLIMSIIPFGIAGSVWALYLHGKPLSILAILGMAALVGVIVNDSVVFVDFINNHRGEFPDIRTAILDGGKKRFKQIILTTLTSLGGLLPLAYGLGGKDNILMQMALTFCWGLGCGTLFTLFFVPYFYLVIEDIKKVCGLKKE